MKNSALFDAPLIAQRLKALRQGLEKTQKDMAAWTGVSALAWHKYEAGENLPGGKVLATLRARGMNVNWILGGDGPAQTHYDFSDDAAPGANETDILKQVIAAVEEAQAGAGLNLPAARKADLISHLYSEALAEPDLPITPAKATALMKLMAT